MKEEIEQLKEKEENNIESKIIELVMKELNVKVEDMPAYPPAKMERIDIIRLAIKIGLAKFEKAVRDEYYQDFEEYGLDWTYETLKKMARKDDEKAAYG